MKKQEEFLKLLNPIKDNLSRYCRSVSYSYDDAKDLMSETILIAYQSFSDVREDRAFLSYLFTIASRLNMKKKEKAKKFDRILDNDYVHYQSIEESVDVNILYNMLQKLPLKQAEAIILFEVNGFNLEEIKEIQGGTLSGVKSRLKRARESLKSELDFVRFEKKSEVEI